MNWVRKPVSLLLIMVLLAGNLVFPVQAEEIIIHGIGYVIPRRLQLYSEESAASEVLDTAAEGECVIVLTQDETWCKVSYNLQEGYMCAKCLDVLTQANAELGYGKVNSSIAYLRSGAGTEYSILTSLFRNKEYYILGIQDGWYKILNNNATGYIRSDLLDLTQIPYLNEDSEIKPQFYSRTEVIGELTFEETQSVAMAAAGGYYAPISGYRILGDAQKFIGVPYVFGGYSPAGFDCSGLVYYVLTQMGYPAHRTAAEQYNMGYEVSRKSLKPGDLVFFANTYTSGISHVGIYAGNKKFLHAPSDGGSVCYAKLSGYWADHYYGARRIG